MGKIVFSQNGMEHTLEIPDGPVNLTGSLDLDQVVRIVAIHATELPKETPEEPKDSVADKIKDAVGLGKKPEEKPEDSKPSE